MNASGLISDLRTKSGLTQERLAQLLGVSFVSVNRWERGASIPSPTQVQRIVEIHRAISAAPIPERWFFTVDDVFSSRGVRRKPSFLPLLDQAPPSVTLAPTPQPPILDRLMHNGVFSPLGHQAIADLLARHATPAPVADTPPAGGIAAGKNTYTYDAHTYHTKVPPQGIAELLKHYLPEGGLVLDAFGGSGMTGVACRAVGYDSLVNELSPAASFIAHLFAATIEPSVFEAGLRTLLNELEDVRRSLYTTTCRECKKPTEILYAVWSYRVVCNHCDHEFLLWDHCRQYGRRVRDHKILSEFPCPHCQRPLRKSRLKRTIAEPVQIGYRCCGSRQQEVTHAPDTADLALLYALEIAPPLADGFFPQLELPDGVNLRQPRRHGLDRIDRLYTPRNLAAMSHLWRAIHCVDNLELAAHLAFVFTSLYQRVTRLSEFRFWGGSGNTARYNVPFIFNEANVFVTFARKARTILDHLETTAAHYHGTNLVVCGSATAMDYLPDNSVDLIFIDPPFGGNINYSEMNLLWESWLGRFTDTRDEAIINEVQQKDVQQYQALMTQSLRECYRVLRPGHWMLLVFMNSSKEVWKALQAAITEAGFGIDRVEMFDKQHGTFKQFVSENTAGSDLVLHCRKPHRPTRTPQIVARETFAESLAAFLTSSAIERRTNVYLHVAREAEIDFRSLYSEWIAQSILRGIEPVDFAEFRELTLAWLAQHTSGR
jgi:DNA modification methylase/transcriptional regulator with XRE-family HTH domain